MSKRLWNSFRLADLTVIRCSISWPLAQQPLSLETKIQAKLIKLYYNGVLCRIQFTVGRSDMQRWSPTGTVSEKQPPVISEIRLIVSSLIRNQGIGYKRLRISLVKIGKIGRTMT